MHRLHYLELLDAQRFDLSQRRMRPVPGVHSSSTIGSPESPSELSDDFKSPMPAVDAPWSDHSLTVVPTESTGSGNSSDAEDLVSPTPDLSTSPNTLSPTNTSEDSITLMDEEHSGNGKEVVQTDVFENEEFTITRTIIRRVQSRSVLSIFSRSSTPQPSSRSGSPFGLNIGAFNCLSSSHAFEVEIDYLQAEREKDQGLHVRIFQERAVSNQESTTIL